MLVLKEEEERDVDHFREVGALTVWRGRHGLGDSRFTLSRRVSEQPQDLRGVPGGLPFFWHVRHNGVLLVTESSPQVQREPPHKVWRISRPMKLLSHQDEGCPWDLKGILHLPVVQWWRILLPVQEAREIQVWSLDREDPLEKEVATHSSILNLANPMDRGAWRTAVHGVTHTHTHAHAHTTWGAPLLHARFGHPNPIISGKASFGWTVGFLFSYCPLHFSALVLLLWDLSFAWRWGVILLGCTLM